MRNKIKLIVFSVFVSFVLAFGASADTIGQDQSFFISPTYDAQMRPSVMATLRYVSDRAYFYVGDDYWNSVSQDLRNQILDQTKSLAQEFDNRIYPLETSFFGSEPNPGIDNDPRLTILLAPLIDNAGGYFDTSNEFLRQDFAQSNQREIIYLNIGQLNNQIKMKSFLAHEFQHLISFNQKEKLRQINEDTWLNELRSEYAPTLLGYNELFSGSNLERRLASFLSDSYDSLTEWKNLPADYGQIAMFGEYVAEHGSPQVIADTLKNNLTGISSVNESLARNNSSEVFTDIYQDWLIADILNDSTINPKFGYTRNELKNLHVAPTRFLNNLSDDITLVISDLIKDWQGRWYEISQFAPGHKNILKINFSSPSLASFNVVYLVFKNDNSKIAAVFNPTVNSNSLYIDGISKDFDKIILMPFKKDKLAGFGGEEPAISLTASVERVDAIPPESLVSSKLLTTLSMSPLTSPFLPSTPLPEQATVIPDGSLVRTEGDYKIYIVQGRWRRHIVSPAIFKFYNQLGFDKVKTVSASVMSQYQESNLVRYPASKRIYSVDETGRKHWLNVRGEQFSSSGRSWDSVFAVNLAELQYYKIGSNITK